jgi:hypothetical protein
MFRRFIITCAALSVLATGVAAQEKTVMVGGAPMYPSKDIIDNAVNSKDHTTLVAAVKAAGLVSTLKGAGPFTVFAPTNAAFDKLPAGTVGVGAQGQGQRGAEDRQRRAALGRVEGRPSLAARRQGAKLARFWISGASARATRRRYGWDFAPVRRRGKTARPRACSRRRRRLI